MLNFYFLYCKSNTAKIIETAWVLSQRGKLLVLVNLLCQPTEYWCLNCGIIYLLHSSVSETNMGKRKCKPVYLFLDSRFCMPEM